VHHFGSFPASCFENFPYIHCLDEICVPEAFFLAGIFAGEFFMNRSGAEDRGCQFDSLDGEILTRIIGNAIMVTLSLS
jgi:hypothetical protein